MAARLSARRQGEALPRTGRNFLTTWQRSYSESLPKDSLLWPKPAFRLTFPAVLAPTRVRDKLMGKAAQMLWETLANPDSRVAKDIELKVRWEAGAGPAGAGNRVGNSSVGRGA